MAVGALLLVGCSDDGSTADPTTTKATDDTTEDTTTTAPEGGEGELTLEEWVEAADEICADFNDEVDDLGEPESLDELLPMMDDMAEMAGAQRDDLQDLGIPTDEGQDDVERAYELLDDQVSSFEDMVADADDDPEALAEMLEDEELNAEMEDMEAELDELADDLGLEECGKDSDGSGDDSTSTTMGEEPDGTVPDLGSAGTDEELRQIFIDSMTADGTLSEEQATCIADGLLEQYSLGEIVSMAGGGEMDEELTSAVVDLTLGCM